MRILPMGGARIVPADRIDEAVAVLRAGGVVVLPTDTVYGIGALPGDARAVARAFRAARRPAEGPLPVLIATEDALPKVAAAAPAAARRMARAFWPGPLTLVLRRAPSLRGLGQDEGALVAVRVPDHAVAREVIVAAGGALVVVGVGPAGRPPACTAAAAARAVGRGVDLILDGGASPGGAPSSLVDCSFERPRLLRAGAIPAERLARAAMVRFL
jgi:L-threonylcarbamoyladenylate synthase